jgi:broad specificity phosphatase PhoE
MTAHVTLPGPILAKMAAGTPVRILLARHGETVFNVEGKWQGQSDSPLTERGLAQARELARALADEPIAAIYSSDLGRAVRTATEVAVPHQLTVTTDQRLREIDAGAWTGKGRAQIRLEFPGGAEAWASKPTSMRLPDGETIFEAQARALAFFAERMLAHADQTVVVISHGAVGQSILVKAMGGTVEDLWLEQRVDNCQISRLEWTPRTGLKLVALSEVRHLEDVGSLRGWRVTDTA